MRWEKVKVLDRVRWKVPTPNAGINKVNINFEREAICLECRIMKTISSYKVRKLWTRTPTIKSWEKLAKLDRPKTSGRTWRANCSGLSTIKYSPAESQ